MVLSRAPYVDADCAPILAFIFTDTATTAIYTLSLHDALPISSDRHRRLERRYEPRGRERLARMVPAGNTRSEEHTSELQSRVDLVCRLLLEKKKQNAVGRAAAGIASRLPPTAARVTRTSRVGF